MFAYWLLLSIFAVGATVSRPPMRQAARISPLLMICAVYMALMIGLRWEVGADWLPYEEIYTDISRSNFTTAIRLTEPGYALLNWSAAVLGLDIWAVNLVCALLFVWGLVGFARYQSNPSLAIVVAIPFMVIVVAMGYTRQGAAMGIVLSGLAALRKGRTLRCFIYIILASMFHMSAIILVPIIGLTYTRNLFQTVLLTISATLFSYYFILDAALDRYSAAYVEQIYQADGAGIRLAMNIFPALLVLIFPGRLKLVDTERKMWSVFAILSLVLNALYLLIESNVAIDRIGVYMVPMQMMALSRLPMIFNKEADGDKVIPLVICICVISYVAVIQYVWLNFASNAQYWIPYRFISLV